MDFSCVSEIERAALRFRFELLFWLVCFIFQVLSGISLLMKECWHQNPNVRLPALRLKKSLLKLAIQDPSLNFRLDFWRSYKKKPSQSLPMHREIQPAALTMRISSGYFDIPPYGYPSPIVIVSLFNETKEINIRNYFSQPTSGCFCGVVKKLLLTNSWNISTGSHQASYNGIYQVP